MLMYEYGDVHVMITIYDCSNVVCNFLGGAVDDGWPLKLILITLMYHHRLEIPSHISPFVTHCQENIGPERIVTSLCERLHEKTGFLHMRKQSCRSAAR